MAFSLSRRAAALIALLEKACEMVRGARNTVVGMRRRRNVAQPNI